MTQADSAQEETAPRRGRKRQSGLTPREEEVARLAAQGLRRAEIAERLFLSPGTIKRHLRAVRAKLGVTDPWDHDELRHRLETRPGQFPIP